MKISTLVPLVADTLGGSEGITISMVIYFVAMILIGVWAYTRTQSMDDYMLGGRELNPMVAALSAGAGSDLGRLRAHPPHALPRGCTGRP